MAGTAIIGFLPGWLWYSPVLFAKPWMAEMKYTEETMKAAGAKGTAGLAVWRRGPATGSARRVRNGLRPAARPR